MSKSKKHASKKKVFDTILIGNAMKNIRKSRGLTQEEVAEELQLAPRYISDIERDKTKGSLDTLVRLCNVYKITPTFVLKDYLDSYDFRQDDKLVGYYNLTKKEKEIIIKLIEYMNVSKKKHRKVNKNLTDESKEQSQ